MRLLKASKSLIGVDITSSAVKLLELKKSRNTYQVESYAIRPLSDNAVGEGRIHNIKDVAHTLGQALDDARPSTRKAAIAIPSSAAITKMLTLPAALNEEEVEERLMVESDHHLPFAFNDVAFDFLSLGPVHSSPHLQQILLVACRQQDIWHWTEALEQAGLEPVAVDMETFAIERAFAAMSAYLPLNHGSPTCVGLVDIGAVVSSFHVIQETRIVYTHDSPVGGEQLTQAVQAHYALDKAAAEQAKRRGLPGDFQHALLTPFLEALARQVARALQLYYTQGRSIEVTHLVLVGGSSSVPGLADHIATACGIPVTLGNPLQTMQLNKRLDGQTLSEDLPALLNACGLAMRVGL
ncbi:type IV pilus assembly protein PilM [Vreelandella populi]|uniref:Type IV pilus assembly protein PilM n=2 Tax=Vreelandella populi TaxID=2498858 RepID=A0A433LDW6_9GAMM|nr:type IV pilus assembly protein PilM [Halomonas populi]RUR39658.1 type IV pilus assembly protein PilM [Halomonas populi]RUR46799.1 type IV pilus assembly protein PilM [Halomonas populi]